MQKKKIALGTFLVAIIALLLDIFLQHGGDRLQEQNEEWVEENPITLDQDIEAPAPTSAIISRVVDGDTIVVLIDGEQETVRLIGLNAPETVSPQKDVECYGPEASAALKSELAEGDMVTLIADPAQDDRDRYSRLLRYVEEGSQDIGHWLLGNGYAQEHAYDGSFAREEAYKVAESQAQESNLGVWSDACKDPSPSP